MHINITIRGLSGTDQPKRSVSGAAIRFKRSLSLRTASKPETYSQHPPAANQECKQQWDSSPEINFFFLPKNSISKFTPHSQTLSFSRLILPKIDCILFHHHTGSLLPPFTFLHQIFFWHTNACVGSFLSFVNATNCYFWVFKRVTLTSVLALQRWTKTISIGRRFRLCVPNSPSSRTHIIVVTDAVAIIFFCSHWLTKCPLSLQASRRQGQGEGEKEEGTLLG